MNNRFEGRKIFFPQFKRGKPGLQIFPGTIMDHARKLKVEIASECGGKGLCGRCIVRIDRGAEALNPRTEVEQGFDLGEGERLACQARIVAPANIRVFVKSTGEYSILSKTLHRDIEIDPVVYRTAGQVRWRGPEGERSLGSYTGGMYGLAVDVGTTTLVFQLVDLETGKVLATVARRNPQSAYGDDVIARIDYTMRTSGGLEELQSVLIEALNDSVGRVAAEHSVNTEQIYEATIVGNCTMRDIFFGIDVKSLGVIPFEPISTAPVNVQANEVGLDINPAANVYGAALIGGHAGADCLADILATSIYQGDRPSMVIDIGTNGEVALGNKDRIMTCSCAAGAAYEGATVTSGVGAIEGAISNIGIEDGHVRYETIGGKSPIGICGSGLIDLLAELLRAGIMTSKAKLAADFVVSDGICLSQQDVYQLITAKAGLRLDQDVLIKYYGITLDELDKLYLAGGFGNYINAENAIAIGLLPNAPDKVAKVGNAALAGAWEMLVSRQSRQQSEKLANKIEHVKPNELEEDFAFMVADKMYF